MNTAQTARPTAKINSQDVADQQLLGNLDDDFPDDPQSEPSVNINDIDTQYLLDSVRKDVEQSEEKVTQRQPKDRNEAKDSATHSQYFDVNHGNWISASAVQNMFLPFKAKDFNCRFSYLTPISESSEIDQSKIVINLYVADSDDYLMYKKVSLDLQRHFDEVQFKKFIEFPSVFYKYCCVLLDSGFSPLQDFIVSYILAYLRNVRKSIRKPRKLPLRLKIIARIFALRNLKNDPNLGEDVFDENDGEELDDYVNLPAENNWLYEVDKIDFKNVNFNLVISRAIRLSIFLYWQERNLYKKYMMGVWHTKHSFNRRIRYLESVWHRFLLKKQFVSKIQSKLILLETDFSKAEDVSVNLAKKHAFDMLKRKHDSNSQMEENSKNHLNEVTLRKSWRSIKSKSEKLESLQKKAHSFVVRKYFTKWNNKEKGLQRISIEIANIQRVKYYLQMFSKYALYTDFDLRAREFVKKRFFSKWHSLTQLRSKVPEFEKSQRKIVLNRYFNDFFLQRHNFSMILRKRSNEKDALVKKRYFDKWKELSSLIRKAKMHYEHRLKYQNFQKLLYHFDAILVSKKYNRELEKKYFQLWKSSTLESSKYTEFNRNIMKKFVSIWRFSLNEHNNNYFYGECFYDSKLASTSLRRWQNNTLELEMKSHEAEQFFMKQKLKHNFLKGLSKRLKKMTEMKQDFQVRSDKRLKGTILCCWRQKANDVISQRLEDRYTEFVNARNNRIKVKIIRNWKEYIAEIERLQLKSQQQFERKFFTQWTDATIHYLDLFAYGEEFHRKTLMKKSLNKLIDCSNDMYNIRMVYEDLMNSKDYRLMEATYRSWTLVLVKIKQREESIKFFEEKWNKVCKKNIFQLWQQKSIERLEAKVLNQKSSILKSITKNDDSSIEMTGSNKAPRKISPIKSFNARKSIDIFNNDSYLDDFENSDILDSPSINRKRFLTTPSPVKRSFIISSTPFAEETNVSNISHARSEIVKNQRLQNLKNYYRNVA